MKRKLLAGAAFLALGIAASAHAAVVINPDGSVTFNNAAGTNTVGFTFNGFDGSPPVAIAGLSANLLLTLDSISGNMFNFSYSMTNTSTVSGGSAVSGFGFDVTPTVTGVSSTGQYTVAQLGANFTGNTRDVCFSGGPGNCPASNPGNAVSQGATGTGTLELAFNIPQTTITLNNFLDRYQAFSAKDANGQTVSSAIGAGTPYPPIPEPSTWALMIAGFGLTAAVMRRRQRQAVQFDFA